MLRRNVVFALFLSFLVSGCGDTPTGPSVQSAPTAMVIAAGSGDLAATSAQPNPTAIRVVVSGDGSQMDALFPDGTRTSDPFEFAIRVQEMFQGHDDIELEIGVSTPGEVTALWDFETGVFGTPYSVRVSSESGFLGGCIGRTVPHVGFRIRDTRIPNFSAREVFNAHLAGWRENGRWCAGLYVTAKMWTRAPLVCQKICSPSRPSLSNTRQMLVNAMVAAGITYAVATAISWIVGPLLIFA